MSGGVTGDFAKLKKFAEKLGSLRGQATLTAVSSALADATIENIKQGFEEEREPGGRPWADKVFPDGRGVLHGRTGLLGGGWRKLQVTSRDFKVSPADGAKDRFRFAQYGTGIHGPRHRRITPKKKRVLAFQVAGGFAAFHSTAGQPKRPMLPEKGMPQRWRRTLITAARRVLKEKLSK